MLSGLLALRILGKVGLLVRPQTPPDAKVFHLDLPMEHLVPLVFALNLDAVLLGLLLLGSRLLGLFPGRTVCRLRARAFVVRFVLFSRRMSARVVFLQAKWIKEEK